MKRNLITTIAFAGISVALLFAMSVRSFAGEGPPPTPTPAPGPGFCAKACMQKNNGQLRCVDCNSDADCHGNAEVCVNLGSPHGCSSLIGGGTTRLKKDNGTEAGGTAGTSYLAYFHKETEGTGSGPTGSDNTWANLREIGHEEQSIESGGSFRNLNVIVGNGPGDDASWNFTFGVDGDFSGGLSCNITNQTGDDVECTNTWTCVDVNPGAHIVLRAIGSEDTSWSDAPNNAIIRHTIEFNQCVCCDGQPPDKDGNCVRWSD